MEPCPCFSISGTSNRFRRTAGKRLRFRDFCQSSSDSLLKPPAGELEPPTTWAMMSMPPSFESTYFAMSLVPSGVVKSDFTKMTSLGS
jgi:hypothetical protein